MAFIYPRAAEVLPLPPAFNKAACATKIVELREADKKTTEASAVGICAEEAGGSPIDFYRVWDEIEAERATLQKVDLTVFNTEADYRTALTILTKHLDSDLWIAGLKAKKEVSTWTDLKEKYQVVEL